MILPLILMLTIFHPIVSGEDNIFTEYVTTSTGIHRIHKESVTWNVAKNLCLAEGAELAVINSAAEEAELVNYINGTNLGGLWIGVHDLFEKFEWCTINGQLIESLGYVHWADGEPNDASTFNERCAELYIWGMNDLACDNKRNFVCEKNDKKNCS